MLDTSEIRDLLAVHYPNISFLESDTIATARYRDKHIIVFEYQNIAGDHCILKFFSLQHIIEKERDEEKSTLLKGFKIIKKFDTHPRIVRVYDANEIRKEGTLIGFYITMEKFGHTLADLIRSGQSFTKSMIHVFLKQMDNLLHTAHYKLEEPIVHSDIKPSNIGLRTGKNGEVEFVLTDYEVSARWKLHDTEKRVFAFVDKGSAHDINLAYTPPEQIMAYIHRSGVITHRVDIYAIGVIALQMLTGKAPFKIEGQLHYALPFDHLEKEWLDVFSALCNPDAARRPDRIKDVLDKAVASTTDQPEKPVKKQEEEPRDTLDEEADTILLIDEDVADETGETEDIKSPDIKKTLLSGKPKNFLLVTKIIVAITIVILIIALGLLFFLLPAERTVERLPSFRCGVEKVSDIHDNQYKTVQIGNQCWMAENLRTSSYRNGERITNETRRSQWGNLRTGAWAYYENNQENDAIYGKLYNWYAVNDDRGLCPENWRVPDNEDWMTLERNLGMSRRIVGESDRRSCTANIGGKLKATNTRYWNSPNTDATNESGFSGLPGGHRFSNGLFSQKGNFADYWTATGYCANTSWSRRLFHNSGYISKERVFKRSGFSVRCVWNWEIEE